MPKRIVILLLLAVVALTQCQRKTNAVFNTNTLPSEFFNVPVNKDTVIKTSKGAIINIPIGAFSAGAAAYVKLEIKEAYTVADMVLGGLTTKAGKELLSSGGMIYINPADNNNVTISKPISVSIPTDYQRDGMQLYKGDKKTDGTIDWVDPQPLPKQELSEHLQKGKLLFTNNCASCHSATKDATGPPLAFLDQRRDWRWLEHFVYNPSEMIANGDRLSACIYDKYNKTGMTSFPQLSEEELHAIFDYVDYLAKDIDPATIPDFKKSFDSCAAYLQTRYQLSLYRQKLIKENGHSVTVTAMDSTTTINAVSQNIPDKNFVVPKVNDAVYYQVNIQKFGWYNIDILMKGLPGFENSELMVRFIGEYKEEMTIYLVLPSEKILLDGGLLAGKKDVYGFYTEDGMIPLPQNVKAYILAMGEHSGQLYFGKTDFTTSLKQSPEIKVFVTTKEQMNIEIQKLDIKDLTVTAADSKNADSIRKIDIKISEIEKLKPKNCDCNCFGSTELISRDVLIDTTVTER